MATKRKLTKLKRKLRYGVIYVVTSYNRFADGDRLVLSKFSPRLLDLLRSLTGFDIEVIESRKTRGTTLFARRINVGNADNDAIVQMPIRTGSLSEVQQFVKSATDVMSTDRGDQELEPVYHQMMESFSDDFFLDYADSDSFRLPSDSAPCPQESKTPKRDWFFRKKKKKEEHIFDYIEEAPPRDETITKHYDLDISEPLSIEDDEQETITIEQQQEAALRAIQARIIDYVTKYHADPSQLIKTLLEGKIVIGQKEQPSPLVVNNELKIVLPNYNEMEVKMPAMCRAIYILFLKHPEGIALRDIAEHRADLENIYSMVMPGRSEEKAKEAIDNLIDPMSNTLNEYISKIKRCLKSCIINEELANRYCITGKRGEPYRINLAPSLITLPRAVTS